MRSKLKTAGVRFRVLWHSDPFNWWQFSHHALVKGWSCEPIWIRCLRITLIHKAMIPLASLTFCKFGSSSKAPIHWWSLMNVTNHSSHSSPSIITGGHPKTSPWVTFIFAFEPYLIWLYPPLSTFRGRFWIQERWAVNLIFPSWRGLQFRLKNPKMDLKCPITWIHYCLFWVASLPKYLLAKGLKSLFEVVNQWRKFLRVFK